MVQHCYTFLFASVNLSFKFTILHIRKSSREVGLQNHRNLLISFICYQILDISNVQQQHSNVISRSLSPHPEGPLIGALKNSSIMLLISGQPNFI